ncbi:MAG: urea carboxylase-associated family protein [Proteobacteria bacterium]|nr:urea carboxylase-associated family protein [Pseudomonadota bacterium]
MTQRELIAEWTLQPGTGKAVEVKAGQILRIEQVEGGQCVDFNAFNLHDYKEFMHCGRTRTVHGFNPTTGTFMWSAPPRERAMFYILADTVRQNDVLFPRCSAYVYESTYGFQTHTNCHDIQAEAQREYGLTPDDVHDSFNFFMVTEVQTGGTVRISRQDTRPGDHVELLALIDTLAIPNVCGADVMRTSNFFLKPVKVQVLQASAEDLAKVPSVPPRASQRTPKDFLNPVIKADRALHRDPGYEPRFLNTPLTVTDVEIELDDEELALLRGYEHARLYRGDDAATLRDVFFSWWEQRFVTSPNGAPTVASGD